MILESIRAFALEIPFVTAFKHAAAERAMTQALWVEARTQDGTVGCGEGCPREFVTGESLRTANRFIVAHRTEWLAAIRNVDSLNDWTMRHRREVDANPAAWTAVELALLDLLGKEAARPVESLLGLPALAGRFHYTAVLGDAALEQFDSLLARCVKAGFRDFKIKLSGDRIRDREKAASLACAGISPCMVRADANNIWDDPAAAVDHVASVGFSFSALEEPLRPGDMAGLRQVGSALGSKIVLDESLTRKSQLDRLHDSADRWLLNVRVSKMGGLLRSLEIIAEARRRGLQVIVGAHVGETSLLTRAALTVAHQARDILFAQEGACGTHLLASDVVDSPIMFGNGGTLNTASLPQHGQGGFQIEVRNDRFRRYARPFSEEQSGES